MIKILQNKIAVGIFALFVLGLVLFCINPPEIFIAKRGGEFAGHWMLALLGAGMLFLILDMKRHMVISLFGCASIALFLKAESNSNLVLPNQTSLPKITVAHVNLSAIGEDFNDLIKMLEELNVELISFQEVTPDWVPLLDEKLGSYEHKKKMVRIDPYGMAYYSKHPFFTEEIIIYNSAPNLSVSLRKSGSLLYFFSSYVLPPFNKKSGIEAKEHLSKVASKINAVAAPSVSMGGFNMVYWSNEIRSFREEADLQNSRRNTTFEVPHDHIFYTDDLECVFFQELKGADQTNIAIVGTYQIKSDI